jgi:hypothetical protein
LSLSPKKRERPSNTPPPFRSTHANVDAIAAQATTHAMFKDKALAKIMTTPITDIMDPIQRAWLEMYKVTHDRDV